MILDMSGLKKLSDNKVKDWLTKNMQLRRELHNHCIVDKRSIVHDCDVDRILVYDLDDFYRLSKIYKIPVIVTCSENPCFSSTAVTLSFEIEEFSIFTYCSEVDYVHSISH